MRLFQAPLDTCLGSPFFASLSVHGLHFTVYAASIFNNFWLSTPRAETPWELMFGLFLRLWARRAPSDPCSRTRESQVLRLFQGNKPLAALLAQETLLIRMKLNPLQHPQHDPNHCNGLTLTRRVRKQSHDRLFFNYFGFRLPGPRRPGNSC